MQKTKEKILSTTYVALFAALIAVCAFITIPLPSGVPITLQTFGVFAALAILGGRRGTAAISVYILLGAVGVPVFAGFRGGIAVLLGPTGGYIAGFIIAALIYWFITAKSNTAFTKIMGMIAVMFTYYLFGTIWYAVVTGAGASGLIAAAIKCVLPYIIPDAVKCAAALLISNRVNSKLIGH